MGMLLYDKEGKIVNANESALGIMGIHKFEDLSEINLFNNPMIAFKKEEILKKGLINFKTELNFENISGFFTTERSGTVIIEGTVSLIDSGFLVYAQEDTSKEKSEELIISEEKYRRFFEEDLTGDFIATPEGKMIECNSAFAEIYGFSNREEAVGSNISSFNPDDWENLVKRLETEHKIQGHQTTHSVDGKKIHIVSNVVAMFDESDKLIQVKGYVFDDTERKEAEEALKRSEEKYRRLFNEDLTGDFIATCDGEILECNPAFAEIYGFDYLEDDVGSNISQFNTPDWINLITRLRNEGKIQDYQSWQIRPDNKKIHVVANVVGIFNDLGDMVQVKGYVFDDTERKQTEENLKKSEEKYHRLFDEDLTGDFIATLEGKILECNPAFAKIYGFDDCKMAMQWNISESNPFDWPYMVTRLRSEGKIQGFQSWQRRSDFMRIHVVANLVGIFNDSEELVQVKGYVFDDTERKQAEEKLESGKRQITQILDSIQDGFVALDNFWNFIYVNRCAAEYLGVDTDDLLGQNLWERFPKLTGTIYETSFRRAMNEHEVQHFEAPGIRKTQHWFDFSVYPSDNTISIFWKEITQL